MSNPEDTSGLSEATIEAEDEEAQAGHGADREPTPEEAAAAPTEADPDVAAHFAEMDDIGANVKGEGQI